jgi:hypothetical protein
VAVAGALLIAKFPFVISSFNSSHRSHRVKEMFSLHL